MQLLYKMGLKKSFATAVQGTKNANTDPSILHKPCNTKIENEPQYF